MSGIRDFLSSSLGNGFEWIAWIALIVEIFLVIAGFISIVGEHKDFPFGFKYYYHKIPIQQPVNE